MDTSQESLLYLDVWKKTQEGWRKSTILPVWHNFTWCCGKKSRTLICEEEEERESALMSKHIHTSRSLTRQPKHLCPKSMDVAAVRTLPYTLENWRVKLRNLVERKKMFCFRQRKRKGCERYLGGGEQKRGRRGQYISREEEEKAILKDREKKIKKRTGFWNHS